MFKYHCLNPISKVGTDKFTNNYVKTDNMEEADGILVRSAAMHDMELPKSLLAVARAGAGVNNIPLDKCASQGIVVFNTPGANANGVKELVIAGMLLAARDVVGGINLVSDNTEDENFDTYLDVYFIKTIVKNINTKNTNVILGSENINLYGDGYIKDILGEYTFKISPLSFYQVNPIQAEKLYNIGVQAAQISKEDIVFDLYCGIGTISLFMAKYAKKVYGVEIVEQAIEDAKENANINNIENVEFISGDTEIVLDDLINNKNIIPDVVMVDPPRKGLDNKSIENILKIKPAKFVYISCNPATLIRDLVKFEDEYEIKEIQPVDMFPFTSHVECVAVLYLK